MRGASAAALFGVTLFVASAAPSLALGIASISESPSTPTITWTNVGTTNQYLVPTTNPTVNLTGTMQTTPLTGSGSIMISAPATITGTHGAPLSPSLISVTCSGSAISGQTYVANKTPLTPGGSVTCATYSAGFVSLSLNITVSFFLDDRTIYADTYTTATSAFGFVATAS